jgi:hypothetical protein
MARTTLVVALAGAALFGSAIALMVVGGEPVETSAEPVAVTVAGHRLRLPRNVVRFAAQRGGEQVRLDLALVWPELVGRGRGDADRFDVAERPPDVLWATVTAAGDGLDSAARLATIYGRFFEGEVRTGTDGLMVARMNAASGYVGEEIHFEPGAVHPFVARCYPLANGEPPSVCLHDEIVDGLRFDWRFPIERLADWRGLASALPALAARWRSDAGS